MLRESSRIPQHPPPETNAKRNGCRVQVDLHRETTRCIQLINHHPKMHLVLQHLVQHYLHDQTIQINTTTTTIVIIEIQQQSGCTGAAHSFHPFVSSKNMATFSVDDPR